MGKISGCMLWALFWLNEEVKKHVDYLPPFAKISYGQLGDLIWADKERNSSLSAQGRGASASRILSRCERVNLITYQLSYIAFFPSVRWHPYTVTEHGSRTLLKNKKFFEEDSVRRRNRLLQIIDRKAVDMNDTIQCLKNFDRVYSILMPEIFNNHNWSHA